MQSTEERLRKAADERTRLLEEAEAVKQQYLLAQDSVEEEQSVVMRMRVRLSPPPPLCSMAHPCAIIWLA